MEDELDFTPQDAEFDTVPNTDAVDTCEVCGKELVYSGRGVHPTRCKEHKTTKAAKPDPISQFTPAKNPTGDVKAAMQVLMGVYGVIAIPLTMFAPRTAVGYVGTVDQLQERNRIILEANPQLAKQIAATGNQYGPTALIITNLAALGPIALSAYAEVMDGIRQRQANG